MQGEGLLAASESPLVVAEQGLMPAARVERESLAGAMASRTEQAQGALVLMGCGGVAVLPLEQEGHIEEDAGLA